MPTACPNEDAIHDGATKQFNRIQIPTGTRVQQEARPERAAFNISWLLPFHDAVLTAFSRNPIASG